MLTELADDNVGGKARQQLAEVRARADAETPSQVKVNTAAAKSSSLRKSRTAAQIVEDLGEPKNDRKRAREEAIEHREDVVKLIDPLHGKSANGEEPPKKKAPVIEKLNVEPQSEAAGTPDTAIPAVDTTPARDTPQRRKIEKQVEALKKQNVVVSKATEKAIMATSTAPALPVQGRRVRGSGAPVYGDGTLVRENTNEPRSAAQYMLDVFDQVAASPEDLIKKSTEELRVILERMVEA